MLRKYVRQLNPIQENKIEPIVKVQKLLEGSTEAAKEMEYVLVHAAGGKQESEYKNLTPYAIKKNGATKLMNPIIANQCQSLEKASILIFL